MIALYQVDAFTNVKYKGNPAAVCPLDAWPADSELQEIASEINLSETAFYVPEGDVFELRWFTPVREVKLCGHATMAAAHVIFNHSDYRGSEIIFSTRWSGQLKVRREGDNYVMDFPAQPPSPVKDIPLDTILQVPVESCHRGGEDIMVVTPGEEYVLNARPDFNAIRNLDCRALILTSAGEKNDFVSRVFVPSYGIDEDPVTGSAHTIMAPYWGERLQKNTLNARQLSKRGGDVHCELKGDRVLLSGQALTVIKGSLI